MYTPGKGSVLGAATVATVATPAVVTSLPQTGANTLNEIALITAVTLVIWAVVYVKLHKAN